MKKIFLFLAMLSLILTGCGEEKISNELHISAAASLTDAMKEISAEFEKENPDIKIIFNFGSSGALQQAIENGGETDIFSQPPKNKWTRWKNQVTLSKARAKIFLKMKSC